MSELAPLGKLLIGLGAGLCLLGLILVFAGRLPYLGRLPGDFAIRRGSFACFFPLGTSLALSVILGLLLTLVSIILGRLR